MKFTKDTLAALKNFSTINSGVVLSPGNFIMTRSVNGAVYGECNIDTEIDAELSIYDLNGFLSVVSLIDDPEVNVVQNQIEIKGERSTINWPLSDKDSIVYPKKPIVFPTSVVEFILADSAYQELMRACRALSADVITISNNGDVLELNAYNKMVDNKLVKPLYTLTLGTYEGENEFKFVINIGNLKMQPDTYKVQIWAAGPKGAVKFNGTKISYVVVLEEDTKHNF